MTYTILRIGVNPINRVFLPSIHMALSTNNENFICIIQNFAEEIKTLKFEVERLQEMVASMNHQAAASRDWYYPSGLVTIDEIINVIPGSPAKSTVRRWIREDELPCERLNNRKLLFNTRMRKYLYINDVIFEEVK